MIGRYITALSNPGWCPRRGGRPFLTVAFALCPAPALVNVRVRGRPSCVPGVGEWSTLTIILSTIDETHRATRQEVGVLWPTVSLRDKLKHENPIGRKLAKQRPHNPRASSACSPLLGRPRGRDAPGNDGRVHPPHRGKVVGGIYDDCFLLKITPASQRLPDAACATPYEGAKEMLLAEAEDREVLRDVMDAMWEDLPAPKRKK